MRGAFEFWDALDHIVARLERLPGNKEERVRALVDAYTQCQTLGIGADVGQLQNLAGELANIERLICGNGQWDV